MSLILPRLLLIVPCIFVLIGCSSSSDGPKLEGERLSVLSVQSTLEPTISFDEDTVALPEPINNLNYAQAGGTADNNLLHLALKQGELERQWTTNIGKGSSSARKLITQPVIKDGTIYTIDIEDHISAVDQESGRRLWRRNIKPKHEERGPASAGISVAGQVIYVSDGYGHVLALNVKDGKKLWHSNIGTPAYAAPTIKDGRIFVVTISNETVALDAETGERLWRHTGAQESVALIGMPSVTVKDNSVYVAYNTGEVYALRAENGQVLWSDNLSGLRQALGTGLSRLRDVQGQIVATDRRLFLASSAGQVVSMDARTGRRLWNRDVLSFSTPWVAGDMVFVITGEGELVALTKDQGEILWVSDLNNLYAKVKDRDIEDERWLRPILAGGRLLMISQSGKVLDIAAVNGSVLHIGDIGKNISIAPIISEKTLYILDDSATLSAYK